jgi:hypothetical protein
MLHTDISRYLPAESEAERAIAAASRAHCTAFPVLGDGPGQRMQAESHLELCHFLLLNANRLIVHLQEQVRFTYGPRRRADPRLRRRRDLGLRRADRLHDQARGPAPLGAVPRRDAGNRLVGPGEGLRGRHPASHRADVDPVALHNARIIAAVRDPDPDADAIARETAHCLHRRGDAARSHGGDRARGARLPCAPPPRPRRRPAARASRAPDAALPRPLERSRSMSRDFDERFPRFRLGPHDRVTIRGTPFRLLQQTDEAFVLMPTDGNPLPQTFPFAHLNALSEDGQVRQDLDFFLPPAMRTPGPACACRSDRHRASDRCSAEPRRRIRYALVQGFKELREEGQVLMTEASVARPWTDPRPGAPIPQGHGYLAETRPGGARRSRRRSPARRRHDRASDLQGPSETLLNWVRAEKQEGQAGLVDGFAKRGYRRSGLGRGERASHGGGPQELSRSQRADHREDGGGREERLPQGERAATEDGTCPRWMCRRGRRSAHASPRSTSSRSWSPAMARRGDEASAPGGQRPRGRAPARAGRDRRMDTIDLMSIMESSGLLALFTAEELMALGLDDSKARWCLTVAIDCRTKSSSA